MQASHLNAYTHSTAPTLNESERKLYTTGYDANPKIKDVMGHRTPEATILIPKPKEPIEKLYNEGYDSDHKPKNRIGNCIPVTQKIK